MALDLTSFAPALKQYYTKGFMQNMVYKNNPFLALVPKYTDFVGSNMPIPVIYGNPTGRSATFATAQANKNESKLSGFTITRNKDYSLASIDNETLEASQNDRGAFMKAVTVEVDGAIHAATRSLATALYRDGTGAIGRITSTVTGTTLNLATAQDVVNFEVGMKLQFTPDFSTVRAGGPWTVTAVNRSAGTMTVSPTLSGITAADYIYVDGDLNAKVKGLDAWLPASVSATTFFGVNRTADSTRLGGVRYDGSSQPIEEALVDGLSLLEREGGSPDYCFMSFANLSNLKKALGSKVQYVDVDAGYEAKLSFKGVMIDGNKKPVICIGDQNCPAAVAYFIQMDTWGLYSLGDAPRILDSDGNKMLREASSDAVEVRVGYYCQLATSSPGYNARIALAS
ncbi:phage major capsid protein [bacterium]|nr:phage major capsid protein [bacterium]NDD85700.1 phage major capsid protein [bacterium]NDG26185.1 phage major capsid protein [Pseudomonadota bacterium]